MRISDWSSDVCSSDLEFCVGVDLATYEFENVPAKTAEFVASRIPLLPAPIALSVGQDRLSEKSLFDKLGIPVPRYMPVATREALELAVDRKSVVEGKSVSVRVDLGGRRNIKKKNRTSNK